ncbi:4-amino-4-deoxy-L-arabinose-phosphoundecaprenol flippase subunit ArnE, partial [Salmonella enterica subsp. enterica serovar Infantis]
QMLSLYFVWVTMASWIIWHYQVPPRHWLGVALIISGIIILGSAA